MIKFLRKLRKLLGLKSSDSNQNESKIQLIDEAQLRLIKCDYREYALQFWNPYCKSWWTMPSKEVGIHAKWSFKSKGSYGAYGLYFISERVDESSDLSKVLNRYKNKFPTLESIQKYFDKLNDDYDRWQQSQKFDDSLPKIIK